MNLLPPLQFDTSYMTWRECRFAFLWSLMKAFSGGLSVSIKQNGHGHIHESFCTDTTSFYSTHHVKWTASQSVMSAGRAKPGSRPEPDRLFRVLDRVTILNKVNRIPDHQSYIIDRVNLNIGRVGFS